MGGGGGGGVNGYPALFTVTPLSRDASVPAEVSLCRRAGGGGVRGGGGNGYPALFTVTPLSRDASVPAEVSLYPYRCLLITGFPRVVFYDQIIFKALK